MVLAELGGSITRALARMSAATVVDDKALADCLNEISIALLQADFRFETVRAVQSNIKPWLREDEGKAKLAAAKKGMASGGKAAKGRAPFKDRSLLPARKKHAKREDEKAKLEADDQLMPGAAAAGVGELLLLTSFDPFADGLSAAYNYAKILRDLKWELCCSGIVVEVEDLGNVVQLQGDHRKAAPLCSSRPA
ncbi:hypothetical protein BAE44_0000563 [Dichanthelium oligosanthes]|uniref:SUI1 domain-containing protein n=1 Tax=Dichanthelium oligosanthes TaxID=888268 RepID=A0A1E5WM23_9POAL|nr:hypothetical protein BAE44_0000563 [Dichanthelium oligosanthes]